jgi:hypothetical protein
MKAGFAATADALRMPGSRGGRRLLAGFAALGLLAGTARAQGADLQGVYALDSAASDDVPAAIERGTAEMNFAIRGLARSRIAQTNPLYPRILLVRDENSVRLRFEPRDPAVIPLDGKTVPWSREDGGQYQAGAQWSGTQLLVRLSAADGERDNTLTLDPDGRTLRFKVHLQSSRLPAPIDYTLVYRRQEG